MSIQTRATSYSRSYIATVIKDNELFRYNFESPYGISQGLSQDLDNLVCSLA